MGWMILLSIVAGGILIGCACSISQCIPVDVKKLKRSMKPRYSEISWVSDSKCDTSKSVNSFCRLLSSDVKIFVYCETLPGIDVETMQPKIPHHNNYQCHISF